MRRTRLIGSLLTLVSVALGLASFSCAMKQSTTTTSTIDPVARGRYLTTIMNCNDCHTPGSFYGGPDTTRRLAGSDLGWIGPWGVVHARNLTPDSTTGIGTWTSEQIVNALRTGNTPGGAQLAPIMPWMNYGKLDQDDAMAIAAYLKSLPPVTHKNLDRIPPDQKPTGNNVVFPPPPAWDAPPPPAAGATK